MDLPGSFRLIKDMADDLMPGARKPYATMAAEPPTSRQPSSIEHLATKMEKPFLDERTYRVIKLPNQLKALLIHDAETDEASAAMDMNAGSLSDFGDLGGVAHAVEHLLFMGTEKHPGENDYNQILTTYGEHSPGAQVRARSDVRSRDAKPSSLRPKPQRSPKGTQSMQSVRTSRRGKLCELSDSFAPGTINGRIVMPVLDTGADGDFMTESEAIRHGLFVDTNKSSVVESPVGEDIPIIGTVEAVFSFANDTKPYVREFKILARCAHHMILGEPFVRMTKTLSNAANFARRVVKRARNFLPTLMLMGCSTRAVGGYLENEWVHSKPDTGADFTLISRQYAERRGFKVNTNPTYKTPLRFFDGSRATTYGAVEDVTWEFADGFVHNIDRVWVLEGLKYDFILGNDVLDNSKAYLEHNECFYDFDFAAKQDGEQPRLCGIIWETLPQRLKARITGKKRGASVVDARAQEIHRSYHERRRIQALPVDERFQAQLAEDARKIEWNRLNPPVPKAGWQRHWNPATSRYDFYCPTTGQDTSQDESLRAEAIDST